MKKRNQIGRFVLCGVLAVALFANAGCDKANGLDEAGLNQGISEDEIQKGVVLRVGEKTISYDEVMFYVLCIKEQYEGYFGSDIWTVDFGGGNTFEDMCKEDILNEIVQLKIITSMAEEQGVVVTEDEADEIADTVEEQMEEIAKSDRERFHITTELLEQIYHDNYLSSKMFDVVTSDVDTMVSDEEARQADFLVLTLLTKGKDKNLNEIDLNQEEIELTEKKAEELLQQAAEATDFESLATVHSDLQEISITVGRGEMGDAFDAAAFSLHTGELSPVIKGENAFYIVYCVNEIDEDATAEAKERIIGERQDAAFKAIYEEWKQKFTVKVDEKRWAEIRFVDEEE